MSFTFKKQSLQYLNPRLDWLLAWLLRTFWHPAERKCGPTGVHSIYRADSRFAPRQWETALLCNDVSHWLGANVDSALYSYSFVFPFHGIFCGMAQIGTTELQPLCGRDYSYLHLPSWTTVTRLTRRAESAWTWLATKCETSTLSSSELPIYCHIGSSTGQCMDTMCLALYFIWHTFSVENLRMFIMILLIT